MAFAFGQILVAKSDGKFDMQVFPVCQGKEITIGRYNIYIYMCVDYIMHYIICYISILINLYSNKKCCILKNIDSK